MKTKTLNSLLAILGLALASCNTPYGTGTERMVPRADVESVERQAPTTTSPAPNVNTRDAVDYGLDRRQIGFPYFY
jgi:hypothetical protein